MQTDIINTPLKMILLLWVLLTHPLVHAKVPACCSKVQNEKCRSACGLVHAQTLPIPQLQMLLTAAEGCTPDVVDFWQCINNSLPAVLMMSSSSGKTCCDLARGKECRKKCTLADTKDFMTKFCRESMEPSLFACIQRQEAGSQCCNKATTSCGIVCQGIYITGSGGTRATRNILSQHCGLTDKHVEQCMHKQWHPEEDNSRKSLPCCEKAQTPECLSVCRNVFQTVMSEDDRIDELIQACSQPQPTDPLWQCFLNNPSSKKNESTAFSNIDNAKQQCCAKASSSRCRELCTQTYKSSGWSYHTEFESTCSYIQPVSTVESNLHNCLTDVEQPCKLGCSGLSFCSNFNNRPTELFRSCTLEADAAAQKVFNSWQNGNVQLLQMTIPVKDNIKCKPAIWKAIACALEIKPCSFHQSPIALCKEDCLFILTKCVDASSLSGEKTVPALCNSLPSITTTGACVSIDVYFYESPHTSKIAEVTHPCNPSPCSADEICLVRRRKCKHTEGCHPYVCHKVCPLGQFSKVHVPRGTDVRLANLNETPIDEDCYVTCHCNSHGIMDNCQPLICLKRDSCFLGQGTTKAHGEHFSFHGSLCICNAGKVLCSRKFCQSDSQTYLYKEMASNCPTEYAPVCGSNGKTYPNACMARCAGVSSIIASKPCTDVDVCSHKRCPINTKCVPHPQICLNDLSGADHCPQYTCVDERENCNPHHHNPVCSSNGEEFTNICLLYSSRKAFAYWGHCQSSCSETGVVCGQDGETYSSQCAAHAARVHVDYFSKCSALGHLSGSGNTQVLPCSGVQCPSIYQKECFGIVPPGACCPVCATQIKLLWDSRLMAAAASHTKMKVISVFNVVSQISSLISVLECDAFGHVSALGELIVIIGPVVAQPSALQVEACQSEAKRIHSLFKMGSPNIASYLTLSPIVLSTLEHSSVTLSHSHPFSSSNSCHNSLPVCFQYVPSSLLYVFFVILHCLSSRIIDRHFGS